YGLRPRMPWRQPYQRKGAQDARQALRRSFARGVQRSAVRCPNSLESLGFLRFDGGGRPNGQDQARRDYFQGSPEPRGGRAVAQGRAAPWLPRRGRKGPRDFARRG